ncbi:hypothetical protein [Companilactobacillus futsaii]|uniref:Uncharacterized protein n=2 Tax=Companilactobacillus futsaii TaxID=938155 RepID=A0A5B7T3I5_9LACO|nr:hypothetical protein [Companilactobacillus futsaii]KRK95787.1 hypothetical protein FC88_GL002184 [Companilactobacillus futsaii JCM 17355]QCX25120.1 hypothetical protein FG051_08335 [Companilactobacillus futsaii]
MSETGQWLSQTVSDLSTKQTQYENRAFLVAMKKVIEEQNKRQAQLEGEVDGRLWNHEQW